MLSTLGVALTIQKGWAAPEVADAYARAQALSERVGPNPQLFWVLWGMWAFYLVKGDQNKGIEFAQRMMRLANGESDDVARARGEFRARLEPLLHGRSCRRARGTSRRPSRPTSRSKHHANAFLTSQDVGVTARSVASMVLYLGGETELGLARSRDAIDLASELKHPFSQAYALGCAAWLDAYRRAPEPMAAHATATIELSTAQALGFWLVWGMIFAGRAVFDAGETAAGAKHIEDALATYRGIGSGMVVPYFLDAAGGSRERERRRDARARPARRRAAPDRRRRRGVHGGGNRPPRRRDPAQARGGREIATKRPPSSGCSSGRSHRREQQGNRVFALRAATSLAEMLAARGAAAEARADARRGDRRDSGSHRDARSRARPRARPQRLPRPPTATA